MWKKILDAKIIKHCTELDGYPAPCAKKRFMKLCINNSTYIRIGAIYGQQKMQKKF